jgi:large subunit ribosomal protein L22
VKLRHEQVKKKLAEQGMTVEQLADAVERDGLEGAKALSAARNWIGGSNHPRCSRTDMEAIASALGCTLGDVTRFVSEVRHHRGSTRKARLVVDMIRGKSCRDANDMLSFSTKRAAVNIRKALQAAIADAESLGVNEEALVVVESRVDEGPHIKRFRPKDRGRAHPILKRTSHITIGVEERA